ncbi:MAG: ABC transporter ATP-binding protein [Capsulimonadaceae bacterium]|nr:ABC transporter ATP-binding protein [Capsulimonadaceae bacterium]
MDRETKCGLAVETYGLTKHYAAPGKKAKRLAVSDLNLEVPQQTIFGFLGPNGAGKTTTIKMLLGFTAPTFGTAWMLGRSTLDCLSREQVGYLPEQPYFPRFLTVLEVVRSHGVLAGLSWADARRKAAECLELVEMSDHEASPLSKLSKGMMQRIALASALVGDPKLLILDEPSSGLDPIGRKFLRDLLMLLRTQGKTIFLSSHLLSEMETVCDCVAVLSQGRLVASGRPSDIVQSDDSLEVRIEELEQDEDFACDILRLGGRIVANDRGLASAVVVPEAGLYRLIDLLRPRQARLISVAPRRETLEDAFVRLVS